MDLEGFARRGIKSGITTEEVRKDLIRLLRHYKGDIPGLDQLASAILAEIARSRQIADEDTWLFEPPETGVTMGKMGVGSRGQGDFYVHHRIADLTAGGGGTGRVWTLVDPLQQDDGGVIGYHHEAQEGKGHLVLAVDGTHSRLSDYPFLAGFHVTRATVRDVYVMGGIPLTLLCDLHLSDDGDVGKLFDFMAGVQAAAELLDIPVAAGSTLRTGGDMVIGDRMVSGVGCVGTLRKITPRANLKGEEVILLTEGKGGGTITTTAIYSGNHKVAYETLNIDFSLAMEALYETPGLLEGIHTLTDVTNGGIRGDCLEIARTTGLSIYLDEQAVRGTVSPGVLSMLDAAEVDFMGVSVDSLMVFCRRDKAAAIIETLEKAHCPTTQVGEVINDGKQGVYIDAERISGRFREAPYTEVKKVYGISTPEEFDDMKKAVYQGFEAAVRKKERVKKLITPKKDLNP